jgi:hypothetical protein
MDRLNSLKHEWLRGWERRKEKMGGRVVVSERHYILDITILLL